VLTVSSSDLGRGWPLFVDQLAHSVHYGLVLAYDFGELFPQDGVELFLDLNHLRTWSFFDLINRMIFQEELGGFIKSCFNLHLREIVASAFPAIIKESALGDFW